MPLRIDRFAYLVDREELSGLFVRDCQEDYLDLRHFASPTLPTMYLAGCFLLNSRSNGNNGDGPGREKSNSFIFNNLRYKNSFTTLAKLCIIALEFVQRQI